MELLRKNFANTTTQFTVSEETATVANVMMSDPRFQWATSTFTDDATTASMRIAFDVTTAVDRIALVGHNLKTFKIFYNDVTANVFSLESGAGTSTANFSTNSSTSQYFKVPTAVNCTSITIDMTSTITPNQNKAIGYLVVSEKITSFSGRVPSANNYKPALNTQAVVHQLSDGGTRIQTVEDKWGVKLGFDFLDRTARDELRTIFDDHDEIVFAAFGTTSGWDGLVFPCVWLGGFDFYAFSDNASDSGFSGTLTLVETPQ